MKKDDCFYLGYISKLIGTNGEVGLKLDVDEVEKYHTLKSILLQMNERDQILVPFFIDHSQPHVKSIVRIKLKQVDSSKAAKAMVGKSVFLPLTMLPNLDENQFYYHEISGYAVEDEQYGEIGNIKEVLEYPGQDILQIITTDETEVLVPLVEDTIIKVDKKSQKILIKTPEGLIDLYLQ